MADLLHVSYAAEHTSKLGMKHHLLNIPPEILTHILHALVPPFILAGIRVRWMFIRTNYQIQYLPVTPLPRGSTSLLLVCSRFKDLIVQMLYGLPRWQCDCRLERLRLQIGASNFASIRRMAVSVDDLKLIADTTELEVTGSLTSESHTMRFTSLEELYCEGYEWDILLHLSERSHDGESKDNPEWTRSSRSKYMVQNAASLCVSAAKVLRFHPRLDVLVQKKLQSSDGQGSMRGGADAIDTSAGRAQWRFLRSTRDMNETEEVVTSSQLRQLVEEIGRYDETLTVKTSWPDTLSES